MSEIVNAELRYMVSDHLTLDDSVAFVHMSYPTRLTACELDDVEKWFALRVKNWKRNPLQAKTKP